MSNKRIGYIDNIKGFAILLVIMGHLLDKSILLDNNILNRIIYSTHMPLFMYISGLLAFRSGSKPSITSFFIFLQKKVLRLLIPYFTIGIIYGLLKANTFSPLIVFRNMEGYWFFPVLFICMFCGYIQNCISLKFNKNNNAFIEILFIILLYVFLVIGFHLKITDPIPYYLHFLKMFPFYIFGYFTNRCLEVNKIINSNYIFALSLVFYIFLILYPLKISFNICGFFAIIIINYIFKIYESSVPSFINLLGQNSLEIYSLHWFLLPNLIFLRGILQNEINYIIWDNGNFVILTVILSFFSIIISYFCIAISKILKLNNFLSFIVFGINKNGNNNK